ncbi:hypothetical protein M8C13_18120 [Crossiella sp. SN42]|uniref:hypothetical protein n=1 Tax=Crossiella sp. SN42 TaxID=2944808 RepID=UPI00207C9388|nr:hypothetical protein [Crossiella sp. SN42]MCO1577676.1 hypothetical protein [Crossiella sp. SN42]
MEGEENSARTSPTAKIESVSNKVGDVAGAAVQAGAVHGDIHLHPSPRRIVDEERRAKTRERWGIAGELLVILVFAGLFISLMIIPWKSVFGTLGPPGAPGVSTAHVGDCAARHPWYENESLTLTQGIRVRDRLLVKVPCWHRSAAWRVVGIVPEPREGRVRPDGTWMTDEEMSGKYCRTVPGWDAGIKLITSGSIFCLAHT